VSWLQVLVTGLGAVPGGFAGGWFVAYRMGRWRQKVEDQLAVHEARLQKGNPAVDAVPVLEARLNVLIEEFRGLRKELREDFKGVVTKDACDRRHD